MTDDATPTEDRSPLNRGPGSMRRRLMLWLLLTAVVPTVCLGVWMERSTTAAIERVHRQSVTTTTQAMATALSGRLGGGWSAEAGEVVDSMALDPRVGLVVVLDRERRELHRRVVDAEAWLAYERLVVGAGAVSIDIGRPERLGETGGLLAQLQPVWDRPPGGRRGSLTAGADRRLEGFVVLGMRERSTPFVRQRLRAAQIAGCLAVGLVMLPVAVWSATRWTRPIRRIESAAVGLAEGRNPEPLPEGQDEVGQLARSFNAMSRKLNEARRALLAANRELEAKVDERTQELNTANGRLKAEMADKDAFLRAVSHDLGAPLRNIDGMASMLLMKYKTDLADDALRKLERISANAKLQTDLIGDLLELSRIRSAPPKRTPVDLDALVRDIVDSLGYELDRYGIELNVEAPLPTLTADRNRMRQVFQNLLDNAVKYTREQPTRRIAVRWTQRAELAVFEIEDTGCGIDPRDQQKVFHVFQRASQPPAQVEGRGVGLASVRSIIESHGGWIEVESQPGEGSTFRFALPKAQADATVAA
ncbi:MAG: HAMP domain-containing sensor histidine kinase [Planctomycetota bacterium]